VTVDMLMGNTIDCKVGDRGADFVVDSKGNLAVTCIQTEDSNDPDMKIRKHTEKKIFLRMVKIPASDSKAGRGKAP
jgi:hypothetical protein